MGRIAYVDLHPPVSDFRAEVLAGLSQERKSLSPKWFYDEKGSWLFDAICDLDEYYPTRTETAILGRYADAMGQRLGPDVALIEYGSGASVKVRTLLDSDAAIRAYIPIDISRSHLLQSAENLARVYPALPIAAVCADYTRMNGLPQLPVETACRRRTVFFPGSTIGNLTRAEAGELLAATFEVLRGDGDLLVGIDLIKDIKVLIAAYNDKEGVTAAFNRNILERINRELGADFEPEAFVHEAIFNAQLERIEMHLVSTKAQTVTIGDRRFSFEEGESIHTENSHKFTVEGFAGLAAEHGFRLVDVWMDERKYFAEVLLRTCHLAFND